MAIKEFLIVKSDNEINYPYYCYFYTKIDGLVNEAYYEWLDYLYELEITIFGY